MLNSSTKACTVPIDKLENSICVKVTMLNDIALHILKERAITPLINGTLVGVVVGQRGMSAMKVGHGSAGRSLTQSTKKGRSYRISKSVGRCVLISAISL